MWLTSLSACLRGHFSGTANGAAGYSVLPCIDKEGDYGLFTKRFGSLQSMQTFYKYKARSIRPYSDRRL
jgi:hypothetical protein